MMCLHTQHAGDVDLSHHKTRHHEMLVLQKVHCKSYFPWQTRFFHEDALRFSLEAAWVIQAHYKNGSRLITLFVPGFGLLRTDIQVHRYVAHTETYPVCN